MLLKKVSKIISVLFIAIALTLAIPNGTVNASSKRIKVSVYVSSSKKISTKSKIKSVKSSNKKVCTVKKLTSKKFKITGKKAGKATVTVKTKKGTLKYSVTIKKKKSSKKPTTKKPDTTEQSTTEAPTTTEEQTTETPHTHNMQPSGTETTWVTYENIYERRCLMVKYPYLDVTNWSATDDNNYENRFWDYIHPDVWSGNYNTWMALTMSGAYDSYALVGKKAVIHHKQTYKCNDPCAQYHSGVGCTKTETKEWTTDGDITTYCPICGTQTSIGNDIMKYWQTVDTTYGYNPNTINTKAIVTGMDNYATLCPNCMPANQLEWVQYEIDNHFDDFVVPLWGDMNAYDENGNWLYPITGIGAEHDLTVINAKRVELGIPVYRPLELWDDMTTPYWN